MAAGHFAGVKRGRGDLGLGDPDLDPATGEAGIERVVVGVPAQVGLRMDAGDEAPVGVRHRLRQRAHLRPFELEPLGRDRAQGAVGAGVGAAREPVVELELEVDFVGEAAVGLEAALDEIVEALEHALGLAVAGIEDHPAEPELAAEGRELVCRLTPAAVDRPLAIPDRL